MQLSTHEATAFFGLLMLFGAVGLARVILSQTSSAPKAVAGAVAYLGVCIAVFALVTAKIHV